MGGRLRSVAAATATLALLVAQSASGNHSVTQRLSTGPSGGNGNFEAFIAGQSEDGTRVFFGSREQLVPASPGAPSYVYERAGGVTKLVAASVPGSFFGVAFAGASADGSRVFIRTSDGMTPDDTDGN